MNAAGSHHDDRGGGTDFKRRLYQEMGVDVSSVHQEEEEQDFRGQRSKGAGFSGWSSGGGRVQRSSMGVENNMGMGTGMGPHMGAGFSGWSNSGGNSQRSSTGLGMSSGMGRRQNNDFGAQIISGSEDFNNEQHFWNEGRSSGYSRQQQMSGQFWNKMKGNSYSGGRRRF